VLDKIEIYGHDVCGTYCTLPYGTKEAVHDDLLQDSSVFPYPCYSRSAECAGSRWEEALGFPFILSIVQVQERGLSAHPHLSAAEIYLMPCSGVYDIVWRNRNTPDFGL